MKAVVLKKSRSRYTVLGVDGTFRHVHRRLNAEVGEEIQIQPWTESFSGIRIWAGAVAIFLMVLTTLLGWTLYQAPTAVALISVDINPSLQFELDNQGHLLKFQTQNNDAKRMLSMIVLKGKPIEKVLEQVVTQAYDQNFLNSENPWVVIGYSPMTNKTSEQMPNELNENQIISWVTAIGEKKGLITQVAVFSLTLQERELAQEEDLTLGEYALWETADKVGIVTQPQKLKNTLERVRLLENPQIQAEMKSVKKGIESGILRMTGTKKLDPGSIAKPNKEGTGKPMSDGLPFSSSKVPNNPEIEKGKGQYKEKDLGQESTKGLDQTKNSGNKKTGR